jgi:hypothetical protein
VQGHRKGLQAANRFVVLFEAAAISNFEGDDRATILVGVLPVFEAALRWTN